jgi:hypothetical protein
MRSEMDDTLRQLLLQDEFVHEMICRRAYEIYQDRGRGPGHDRDDWLQAEREILDGLIGQARAGRLEVVLAEYGIAPEELSGGPASASHGLTGLQAAVPQSPYPDRYYNPHPNVFEDFVALAAETISFQVPPAAVAAPAVPEATPYVEQPGKKREKTPKPEKPRKHKKAAAGTEDSLIVEPEKAKKKKSGHKSKEGKSKETKSKENKKK